MVDLRVSRDQICIARLKVLHAISVRVTADQDKANGANANVVKEMNANEAHETSEREVHSMNVMSVQRLKKP